MKKILLFVALLVVLAGFGGCKSDPPTKPRVVEVTDANFWTHATGKTVVVDFWAPWCMPCKKFSPTFDQWSAKHQDVTFVKVNIDNAKVIKDYFKVESIPTVVVIRNGKVTKVFTGVPTESAFEAAIK